MFRDGGGLIGLGRYCAELGDESFGVGRWGASSDAYRTRRAVRGVKGPLKRIP
jgi:hypothetical protein